MVARCHDPANRAFKSYGGRGISVCERWHDPYLFLLDVQKLEGWDDASLELDRIENNNGYEPGNVRYVTRSRNMRNTRKTFWVEYKGVKYDLPTFRDRFCPWYREKRTIRRKIEAGRTAEELVAQQ